MGDALSRPSSEGPPSESASNNADNKQGEGARNTVEGAETNRGAGCPGVPHEQSSVAEEPPEEAAAAAAATTTRELPAGHDQYYPRDGEDEELLGEPPLKKQKTQKQARFALPPSTPSTPPQTPRQAIMSAATPSQTPPGASFPEDTITQMVKIPVMTVSQEQLARERKQEVEARRRGELPGPLLLPIPNIARSSRPSQRSQPDQRVRAPAGFCKRHGPDCDFTKESCDFDSFMWPNRETGRWEERDINDIPKRVNELGKLRPDYESLGLEIMMYPDEKTGKLEELVRTKYATDVDDPVTFAWDIWIGNIGLRSEDKLVKEAVLAMQNEKEINRVPKFVVRACDSKDGEGFVRSDKWLRVKVDGKEELSQITTWDYLLAEMKWKRKCMRIGKGGIRDKLRICNEAAVQCNYERKLRRDSRSSYVGDEESGLEAERIVKRADEGAEEVRAKVQLGYRRREDRGQGEHWLEASEYREHLYNMGWTFHPTEGWRSPPGAGSDNEEAVEDTDDEDEDQNEADIAQLNERLKQLKAVDGDGAEDSVEHVQMMDAA